MITIDKDFETLLPQLTTDEKSLLESSIRKEGCRDPLLVWKNSGSIFLVDGHNRYEICSRLAIPYKTKELSFADKAAVQVWILTNQSCRRNLTKEQKAEIAKKLISMGKTQSETAKAVGMSQQWVSVTPSFCAVSSTKEGVEQTEIISV